MTAAPAILTAGR